MPSSCLPSCGPWARCTAAATAHYCAKTPVSFFAHGNICLAALHSAGEIAAEVRARLSCAAREVALVGDFNGWDEHATPMLRRPDSGAWSAHVALAPGRHVYAFVIDGKKWLVDPLAPQVPDDGFGPANAVVVDGPQ